MSNRADRYELKPIPITEGSLDARNYHLIEIDFSDPRGREKLVDIEEYGISVLPYYHITDGSNEPYCQKIEGSLPRVWCREALVPMLQTANQILALFETELVVYDAYRPVTTQKGLWRWALEKVMRDNPNLPLSEVEKLTSQYSSDPRRYDIEDPTTWPIHTSGGSIDVMLRSLNTGHMLDMGTSFDDFSFKARTDHLEQALLNKAIESNNAALLNRRLLYWAMTEAGFENYPFEYWHYDFGIKCMS